MDVRIVVKVGVKNQKNLLFHIRSVVNHSKTREQSFSMKGKASERLTEMVKFMKTRQTARESFG